MCNSEKPIKAGKIASTSNSNNNTQQANHTKTESVPLKQLKKLENKGNEYVMIKVVDHSSSNAQSSSYN